MKCPKCRKEIPYDAMAHAACGWKLASREVVQPPTPGAAAAVAAEKKPPARMSPFMRLELDRLLKKFKTHEAKKQERVREDVTFEEVTPGHGRCFCELCFKVIMERHRRHGTTTGVAPETTDQGKERYGK